MTDPTKRNNATALVPLSGEASPVVPDDLLDVTARDAGLGVSTDPADQILPLITVLQTNSSHLNRPARARPPITRGRRAMMDPNSITRARSVPIAAMLAARGHQSRRCHASPALRPFRRGRCRSQLFVCCS